MRSYIPKDVLRDFDFAAEGLKTFYCCQCKAWLRWRPAAVTDAMLDEAKMLNGPRKLWRLVSHVGNKHLIDGTLTLAVSDRRPDSISGDELGILETRRYCPKCAPIAKDALLQLGFNLGVT